MEITNKKRNIILRVITLLLVFWSGWSSLSFGQERRGEAEITGQVTDDQSGETLPGVNILVKGTTTGTSTDQEGFFELEVASLQDTLVISFVGYERQEIPVNGRTEIDIALQPQTVSGEEVVVVGYGTQEQREITGAVSSVSEEDFNKGNVNDPVQLLQGKVAGLSISKPGSNPNQGYAIRLRGISTLEGSASPLIVVDGVIGADLNSIDPSDIKSVDILKDASAAAIYGSRGASGVILITTKSGKAEGVQIDYNGYVSADQVSKDVQVMSADEYRELGEGVDYGANTDWFDELTRTAASHVHSLALSGGSSQTSYRASVNYRDIDGILLNTGYKRLNGRINLEQKALNDRLSVSLNLTGTQLDSWPGFNGFRYATIYNPTAPVRSDEAEYEQYGGYFQQTLYDYYNPVAIQKQNSKIRESTLFNFYMQGEFEPVKNLSITGHYSRERRNTQYSRYYAKNSLYIGMNENGFAERRSDKNKNELFEATVNFIKSFAEFELEGLAGYSYQQFTNDGLGAEAGDFLTDAFTYNNLGAAKEFEDGEGSVFSYKNRNRIIGFFGRLNLNYNNTYFLSVSLRREGSTMFGKGNKWGSFPAVSAGVTLSELMNTPHVDNLKLRASYGIAGNTPGDPYLSLLRLEPVGYFYYDGEFRPSYGPTSNSNPNLRWERKAEFDIGLDFSLFANRLSGTFDYYKRSTTDLIYPLSVPVPPNLVSTTQLNIGEISSSGLEAALDYRIIQQKEFTWTAGLKGSYFIENKLVTLSDEEEGLEFGGRRVTATMGPPGQNNVPVSVIEEGEELGMLWGYVYEGVSEDGEWVFKDLNDDGTIDSEDETVIGNGLPDYQFGLNNTFTYGNFDLNLFFRASIGHDLANTVRAFYEANANASSYNVVKTKYYNPDLTDSPRFNSIHVEDASFLKLDNATLGYTLPASAINAFSKLRLYVSGQNLFVITGYTGADPEVRQASILAPGIDSRDSWFSSRTLTVGIQASF